MVTLDSMVEALGELVAVESPSNDLLATRRCAEVAADIGSEWLGTRPEHVRVDGHTHLLWKFGSRPSVVALGHLDTVWPIGTLERWPFSVESGIATGPGVFDMKAGVVQALAATALLDDRDGLCILMNSDEEVGSATSRALIEELSQEARAVLVFEPSFEGALKLARKGVSNYLLTIGGRAAHAGLEPDQGVNALVELAHQVLALSKLHSRLTDASITPTLAQAGTTVNTVPALATIDVDVRAGTVEEQQAIDAEIRNLPTVLKGASLNVDGGPSRPPFPEQASAELFERAVRIARQFGVELTGVSVGGASDGNFTAARGVPTLDGLGAVGSHAHAMGECVVIAEMMTRSNIASALMSEMLRG